MASGQLKLIRRSAGSYDFQAPDGVVYEIAREPLVRDGGSGMWYCGVFEPGQGCCIDARVPEEHFRTLRQARAALEEWIAEPRWAPSAGVRELEARGR